MVRLWEKCFASAVKLHTSSSTARAELEQLKRCVGPAASSSYRWFFLVGFFCSIITSLFQPEFGLALITVSWQLTRLNLSCRASVLEVDVKLFLYEAWCAAAPPVLFSFPSNMHWLGWTFVKPLLVYDKSLPVCLFIGWITAAWPALYASHALRQRAFWSDCTPAWTPAAIGKRPIWFWQNGVWGWVGIEKSPKQWLSPFSDGATGIEPKPGEAKHLTFISIQPQWSMHAG